jgi:hypothetical protein
MPAEDVVTNTPPLLTPADDSGDDAPSLRGVYVFDPHREVLFSVMLLVPAETIRPIAPEKIIGGPLGRGRHLTRTGMRFHRPLPSRIDFC